MTGIFSLLLLIADVFAIVKTVQSRAKNDTKVIWVLVIFFLPFLGAILWWFMGPKK